MIIDDFVKTTGKYLTAKDVNDFPNQPFIILNEGNIVISEKFKTQKLELQGEFNKEPRILDLSKTNARIIVNNLGSDTKKWIGRELYLETYKTRTSEGKLVEAINIKEVR